MLIIAPIFFEQSVIEESSLPSIILKWMVEDSMMKGVVAHFARNHYRVQTIIEALV